MRSVVKRTARAILLDEEDRMVLIKRTKPGSSPYWITPGGGVEPEDTTVTEALRREVFEELGGKIGRPVPAFVDTVPEPGGVKVQHFFACRLESMDPALRHGPEVDEPNGEYDIVRVPFTPAGLASVGLVPASLAAYLRANVEGIHTLLAGDLG
ncbi:NUDIX domain-containing protein [Embleya sp. NPDC055664]|uniref:NUDIX domain-containing protein n=1 Tax=unclassified Embleya TaxID=2699296 RepID=UPI003689044D